MKPRYPKLQFDQLKMYRGRPYVIDLPEVAGTVTCYAPTIGDIVDIGEERFMTTLSLIVGNTTQFRVMLDDAGLDWNEVSDFQLFCMTYKQLDPDVIRLLFKDLDFSGFAIMEKPTEEGDPEIVLSNKLISIPKDFGYFEKVLFQHKAEEETENDGYVEINEVVYQHFHQYYQSMFNMAPEELITHDSNLKQWWLDEDRRVAEIKQKQGKEESFSFLPLISSYINHPGTKYSSDELDHVNVAEFFDSIQRLNIYESSIALLHGIYGGFLDVSGDKIKPEDYNWMRAIEL